MLPGRAIRSIVILLLVIGCSPQKRLDRLIRKHPELVKVDTATVIDTVIIPKVTVDTVLKDTTYFRLLRDTIVINNDRLTIRQYHTRDSIFITGECKDSIIIREVSVPYQTVKAVTSEKIPLYIKIIIVLMLVALLYVLVRKNI